MTRVWRMNCKLFTNTCTDTSAWLTRASARWRRCFKRIAIQEMGHVERLAERIIFLKGDVEMVAAGPSEKVTNPQKMLAKAGAMERELSKSTTNSRCKLARAPTLRPDRPSRRWSMTRIAPGCDPTTRSLSENRCELSARVRAVEEVQAFAVHWLPTHLAGA